MKLTYKYRLKKSFHIGYIILLCLGFLLTIGRWYSVIDTNFVVINAEIHSHISNFSLSMIFYLGLGYIWLLYGVRFKFVVMLGIFAIISNLICETLMGFMNTTDIVDAVYGIAGVVIVFLYLSAVNKYGLVGIDSE